jgi:predicted Fe-Mo cluster-binding NifX family protein
MKVLIAAQRTTLDSPVAKRFGHAPYYLIVDLDSMQVQVIDNTEHHDGTHAIIPQMAKNEVKVFITGNIGPHAFELANSFNQWVVLARKMSAREALAKLLRGEPEILAEPTLKRSVHDHTHHSPNQSDQEKAVR